MSVSAANTARKQRGNPFKPGESGNPAGKPKGARHRATLAIELLLDGEAEALTRKAVELALAGDMQALRLCLERILPPRKDRPVSFDLAPIESATDAKKAMSSVLAAVASGEITPSEANDVARIVDTYIETIKTTDLEERLQRMEERETKL